MKVIRLVRQATQVALAAPRFILHVLAYAFDATRQHIRRVGRALRAFALTFVKTLARRVLLAFLRPIGLALQSIAVWSTTFLLGALTAVLLGAVYGITVAVKYVWGQRGAPAHLCRASWVGLLEMVRESYQVRLLYAIRQT